MPPREVILRHKDFDTFMSRYQQYYTTRGIRRMLYHDRRKLVYIVLIIIFLLLMLFGEDQAAPKARQVEPSGAVSQPPKGALEVAQLGAYDEFLQHGVFRQAIGGPDGLGHVGWAHEPLGGQLRPRPAGR